MTKVHRRSVITREGWYYLFILGFVVLGSLLRNIQLMVGLSTILATAMIVNWRWSKAMVRGLNIRRLPLETLWAGQLAKFRCEIHNTRGRLSAFSLMITQRFKVKKIGGEPFPLEPWYRRWLTFLLGSNLQHFHLVDAVHPGQRTVADLTVVFGERGEYESGSLGVASHFPLGLVRQQWEDGQETELIVGPAIGTLSQSWVEQMLGLGWQDARAGQIARSGDDFYNLRPYSSGDSQRWIHWRASARHNTLLVRQFQRSQSKAFSLFVDLWSVEGRSAESKAACEKMLRVLATISAAVRAGHLDSVRLTLIAETESSIEFPASDSDWTRWHRALATALPHGDIDRLGAVWGRIVAESVGKAAANSCPIVWLSPLGIDQYVKVLEERFQNNGQENVAEFWRAQQAIRSWLTPGDGWLSSWYLEPTSINDEQDFSLEPLSEPVRVNEPFSRTGRRSDRQAQPVEVER